MNFFVLSCHYFSKHHLNIIRKLLNNSLRSPNIYPSPIIHSYLYNKYDENVRFSYLTSLLYDENKKSNKNNNKRKID